MGSLIQQQTMVLVKLLAVLVKFLRMSMELLSFQNDSQTLSQAWIPLSLHKEVEELAMKSCDEDSDLGQMASQFLPRLLVDGLLQE